MAISDKTKATLKEVGVSKDELGEIGQAFADRLINSDDSRWVHLAKFILPDGLVDSIKGMYAVAMALQAEAFVLDAINARLDKTGVGLHLTTLSVDGIKSDVDRFAANYINAKLGTSLTGIRNLSKDQLLEGLGQVMAQRINSEAGTTITNIFPVARLRQELSYAVIDQVDSEVDATGAVLTRAGKAMLKDRLLKKMAGYTPPPTPSTKMTEVELAENRAKQKKYRMTHKAIYVNTAKLEAAMAASGMTASELRDSFGLGD